jgi:hypothetical protein
MEAIRRLLFISMDLFLLVVLRLLIHLMAVLLLPIHLMYMAHPRVSVQWALPQLPQLLLRHHLPSQAISIWKAIKTTFMKKLLFSLLLLAIFTAPKAQLISTVDTSYHPVIDTSVHGLTTCQIVAIPQPLINDSIVSVSINGTFNNHVNLENETINLNDSKGTVLSTYNFTLQGQNYLDVQNNGTEYLFQVIATYLYNTYHFRLTFK